MQRLRKATPTTFRSQGNVNVFVVATGLVIGALWLGFQPNSPESASTAAALNARANLVANSSAIPVSESLVVAPRVTPNSTVNFEQPKPKVSISAPATPRTYWQQPG